MLLEQFSDLHILKLLCTILFTFILSIVIKKYLRFVSIDEQVFIDGCFDRIAINGPKTVFINPFTTKKFEVCKALSLGPNEYCVIKNILTGERYIQQGPKLVWLKPYDKILPQNGKEKRVAVSLKANEYIRFIDNESGKIRVLKGEQGCVVPGPYEQNLDSNGKRQAIDLKIYEYVKIENKQTGTVRTVRGENLVFLDAFEEIVGQHKLQAVEVDEETAVLVRNKRTGQQHLVTEKMLFVPSNDEEVKEVRKLIKLADYEACIIRDKSGKDTFYFGSNENQRSFFLPPYAQLVELLWSRGRRRERRDLRIKKLDLRPMFMSFEFNCRTNDNVELIIEGTFFWEVVDLQYVFTFTSVLL